MNKYIWLFFGICGFSSGLLIICLSLMDIDVPKSVWFFSSIFWAGSAVTNVRNYLRVKNNKDEQ